MLHSLMRTERVDVDMSESIRLLIDPDSKLIRRIESFYRYTPEDLAWIDKAEPALRWDIGTTWTAASIETGAAPAELFDYHPAADFTQVGNFKHATRLATAGFDPQLLVRLGKPAPDFKLTVVDQTGSSRKVAKADLAGKVIVIACWSMHDESCFEELREMQKIVRATNVGDRVVLVAVNVDEDPEDVKELSAQVRQALSKKKVALETARGCLVAVDPAGTIADLLPADRLPAVVLLDGKGIVQSAYSGTGAELTGKLSKEIETLLAGKALETPEFKALNLVDADESRPAVLMDEPSVFKKIEELGGVVVLAGGEGSTAEIDIQLGGKEAGDESLANLVPHLKNIERITRLQLQNTRVTDAGLAALEGMTNIASINLEGTAISDKGLDTLKNISNLKCVFAAGTRVTEDGSLALKRAVPGVIVYYLARSNRGQSTK